MHAEINSIIKVNAVFLL